jgi:hypothetical protein
MSTCIKTTESSQINDLMLHLNLLEKQKHQNSKSRRREIIKLKTEINEIEAKYIYKESIKQKLVL